MEWMLVWTAVGACAAVLASAASLVVAVRSWKASRGAAEAAGTAARHALAAEETARASAGVVAELRRLADQQMLNPLTLSPDGVLLNVTPDVVTIVSVLNAGEFEGRSLPIVVPLMLNGGESRRIDLGQRYADSAPPARLVLSIEGRATPIVLEWKSPGQVWIF